MKFFLSACLFVFPSFLFAASYHHYQLIDTQFEFHHPAILQFESRWQAGENELDQFRIKRVTKAGVHGHAKPILFVAPFNVTLEHYELASTGEYRHSIEAQLALAGFDVWVVEDRVFQGSEEDCEQRFDCSALATWGFDFRLQDIEFARSLLQRATGVADPVIGGITGGGITAIAAVNAHPEHFRALFSTGGFYTEDLTIRAQNQTTCDLFRSAVASGDYYRDSLGGLDVLVYFAQEYPNEPSPIFPQLSNYQFLVYAFTAPGALGFLSYTPTYRFAAPNETLDDYKYMNAELFYEDSNYFGSLVSHNHFTDFYCSIAGERTYMNRLHEYTGSVLMLGGGEGMAPLQIDSTKLFTSANVSILIDPHDGGEADNYLVNFDWRQEVLDRPLLQWLKQQYQDKKSFPRN